MTKSQSSGGDERTGQIITFYSYKGGVGRSMALANIAILLGERCQPDDGVLMIDWDLEAPGLHRYFAGRLKPGSGLTAEGAKEPVRGPGLVELFATFSEQTRKYEGADEDELEDITYELVNQIDLEPFITHTEIDTLHLMRAGDTFDERYGARVAAFDWAAFHARTPYLIRQFAERLGERYRYVLVDSRTGITDTSGICSTLMPEKLVVVFTPNRQSLEGVDRFIQRATDYRTKSSDLRPLVVYPLPSRIEASLEDLRTEWRFGSVSKEIRGYQEVFTEAFQKAYALPTCDLNEYFDEVQIQQSPDYAYGEQIAVLVERRQDIFSVSSSFERFKTWLVDRSAPWTSRAYRGELAQSAGSQERTAAATAERVYVGLNEVAKASARQLFTRLVRLAHEGEGGEDTRRRVDLDTLDAELEDATSAFVEKGVLISELSNQTRGRTLQIADGRLIQEWNRLRRWLEDDREYLLWHQRLTVATYDWEKEGSRKAALLRGTALNEAALWLSERPDELSSGEREYVRTSIRFHRLRRTVNGALIAAVVLWITLSVFFRFNLNAGMRELRSLFFLG